MGNFLNKWSAILSLGVASAAFPISFLATDGGLLLTGGVTVLSYMGSWFVLSNIPTKEEKQFELHVDVNEEVMSVYNKAVFMLADMKRYSRTLTQMRDTELAELTTSLYDTGQSILEHIRGNEADLSASQFFLRSTLQQAHDITENYVELKDAKVSDEKMQSVHADTEASLKLMNQLFTEQRDNYYNQQILESKVNRELIETTMANQKGLLDG